jgi:hypothetical protein
MTCSAVRSVLFEAVFDVITWSMVDLLSMDSNTTVAVCAANLWIGAWCDGGNRHFYPFVRLHPISLKQFLLLTPSQQQLLAQIPP